MIKALLAGSSTKEGGRGGGGVQGAIPPFFKKFTLTGMISRRLSFVSFSKATKNFLTPHSENLVEGTDFSKLMNNSVIGKTIGGRGCQ